MTSDPFTCGHHKQATKQPRSGVLARLRVQVAAVVVATAVVVAATVRVEVPLLWPMGASVLAAVSLWLNLQQLVRHRLLARARQHSELGAIDRLPYQRRRIGDTERDTATALLREHYAHGRLAQAELEDRLDQVLAARTLTDLHHLLRDLPEETS